MWTNTILFIWRFLSNPQIEKTLFGYCNLVSLLKKAKKSAFNFEKNLWKTQQFRPWQKKFGQFSLVQFSQWCIATSTPFFFKYKHQNGPAGMTLIIVYYGFSILVKKRFPCKPFQLIIAIIKPTLNLLNANPTK